MATAQFQSEAFCLQFIKMTFEFCDKYPITFFSDWLLFDCVWEYILIIVYFS